MVAEKEIAHPLVRAAIQLLGRSRGIRSANATRFIAAGGPYSAADEEQAARAFNDASNAVVEHLQAILKHEWERVKKGDV